jgi:hypothetical protein
MSLFDRLSCFCQARYGATMENGRPDIGPVTDIIIAKRAYALLGTVAAVGMAVLSFTVVGGVFAVACGVFFGLGALAGLALVVAPSRLILGARGFTQIHLWYRHSLRWDEIDDFRVLPVTRLQSLVVVDCRPHWSHRDSWWARLCRALTGADFALYSGLGDPEELAARLSVARNAALTEPAGSAPAG